MELMGSRGSIPASVSPIFCHPWKIAVGLPAQDCAGWDWDERSGDQAGGGGRSSSSFSPWFICICRNEWRKVPFWVSNTYKK